eukprot:TRINITY_DN6989_c0_g1_i1.p1 TRINITY_DN6989_c0_g1~~TRINITY_DN6989_c0_g1_i1.p1  ORF type:complete len:357 (-),score=70.62 TRINITY_DN6989_c0_g1_i1:34-1104(-)
MLSELAFLKQFVQKETCDLVSQFISAGPNANYEALLQLVLRFQTSMMGIQKDFIQTAPPEIVKLIVNHCDGESQMNFARTCKRYHKLLNEDFWREKSLAIWDRWVIGTPLTVWDRSAWDRMMNIIPFVRWRNIARNLSNETGINYSFRVEDVSDYTGFDSHEANYSTVYYAPNRTNKEGVVSVIIGNFAAGEKKPSKMSIRLTLGLKGAFRFGDMSLPGFRIECDGKQTKVGTWLHSIIYQPLTDNTAKLTWPSGYTYTGQWKHLVPIRPEEAIPEEITECIHANKCTKTITQKKILPQMMVGQKCLACVDHPSTQPTSRSHRTSLVKAPNNEEKTWMMDSQCCCECTATTTFNPS